MNIKDVKNKKSLTKDVDTTIIAGKTVYIPVDTEKKIVKRGNRYYTWQTRKCRKCGKYFNEAFELEDKDDPMSFDEMLEICGDIDYCDECSKKVFGDV